MLLLTLGLCIASDLALAAAVGDRVELRATHPAGVPLHSAPGGSQRFERVPGGTVATVIGLDRGGSWLELRVPDERTGWISARYVGRTMAGPPPPDTSAERTVWASPEGCQQVVSGGSRMSPADPATLRVGTWNIRWFPRGCPST
jgi:Bacterial SH3 domain